MDCLRMLWQHSHRQTVEKRQSAVRIFGSKAETRNKCLTNGSL